MSQTKAQLISSLVQPLTGADGTQGAPTFSFTDDTDTGLFRPGDNTLGLTTGGSTRLTIDSSGRLLVGTSSSIANRITGQLQIVGTGDDSCASLTRYSSAVTGSPILTIGRSKSSDKGTNTVVANGDKLGAIEFTGADGTNFVPAASVSSFVDTDPGSGDMPGNLIFSTTPNNSSTLSERFRINNQGAFGIGGENFGTSGQVFTSQGATAAPQWASPSSTIQTSSAVGFNGNTDVEFTGIGSNVRRIIFAVDTISSNGNDRITLELGHSSGYTTSGYIAWAKSMGGSSFSTGSSLTSAFDLTANAASSENYSGVIELMAGDSNLWILNSNLQGSADNRKLAGGRVVVGGTLTKIKFDVGSATFDGGSAKMYTFTEA